jgi:Fe/S biogenesis protein NfuA|tara:strand:- start:147 stop:419 length:273 start_codon:yes stop_codon:yes gene_type:complete
MNKEDIQNFIDEDINPALKMHDGYLLIIDLDKETNILKIEMGGGCQGCASSAETLKYAVETSLKERFPELQSVEDITDHTTGENPYHTQE